LIGGMETGFGTGQSNTTIIVAWLNSHSETGKAAQVCDALVYGGYSDWFLPSRDELRLMCTNLKVFGVGGFAYNYYFGSTECGTHSAWSIYFDDGEGLSHKKSSASRVRAARAF